MIPELDRIEGGAPEGLAGLTKVSMRADGVHPFVQQMGLLDDDVPVRHGVKVDGVLVAYAAVEITGDVWRAGLVVDPEARGNGFGELLVHTVADDADDAGATMLEAWAPLVTAAVDRLAYRCGARLVRRLLEVSIALPLSEPALVPSGFTLGTLGDDELDAVVEVNNAAFSWHPEQGNRSVEEFTELQREPWYDPSGFLVARDADGDIAGFCWTKMHTTPRRRGEIFVICVAPAFAGTGLGKALTVAGLEHISKSADTGMLYVDEGNLPARAVYARLGFELERVPSLFRLDLSERIRPSST